MDLRVPVVGASRLVSDTGAPTGSDTGAGLTATPDRGALLIGCGPTPVAYASGANPTNAAIVLAAASSVVAADASESQGVTAAPATGQLTIRRAGLHKLGFNLGDVITATAAGVVTAEIFVNGAAVATGRIRAKFLQSGAAVNNFGLRAERAVRVKPGDLITCVLTGTTGGVITITDGIIFAEQLDDTRRTRT